MRGALQVSRLLWPLTAFIILVAFPGAGLSQVAIDFASCPGMDKGALTLRSDWTIPLLKSKSGSKAILLKSSYDAGHDDNEMNVNSDGSPRAYHLLDPEGREYALNDMYSGGVRIWENGVEKKMGTSSDDDATRQTLSRQYYDVFNKFVKENDNFGVSKSKYNPRTDTAYKLGDDFGNKLDPPSRDLLVSIAKSHATNADFGIGGPGVQADAPQVDDTLTDYNCLMCKQSDCKVCFRKHIVKFSNGSLCIRTVGRYSGFLVNETGLDDFASNGPDPENAEDKTCNTPSNLDPEKLPGLVLPGGSIGPDGDASLTAAKGDVVIGYNPKSTKWVFGVVSDGGPKGKLGEASIAFNRTLQIGYKAGANLPRPIAYHIDLLTRSYQPLRPIGLLLLPGSIERFKKPGTPPNHGYDFSPRTVATKAKAAFLDWAGTTDMDKARDKYLRCLALLPPG